MRLYAASIIVLGFLCMTSMRCKDDGITPPSEPDTTSHNFTWTIETLGDGSGSVLYDVAIINDTLAYAVGEIWQGGITYNAAKWNGNNWQLKQLYYNGSNLIVPIRGVFAFGAYDIWLAAGGVFHWNGISSQAPMSFSRLTLPDPNATIEKLWGSVSSDLYGIGNAGTIVHYDGSNWQKLESGTTVDLVDIWGSSDDTEVWACGNRFDNSESILIRKSATGWQTLWLLSQSPAFSPYKGEILGSLWAGNNKEFLVTGSGNIFRQSMINTSDIRSEVVHLGHYAYRIRGVADNDVAVTGDNAMIWHWNGASWQEVMAGNPAQTLYSIAESKNKIIAVGADYAAIPSRALVVLGRR